ncbi:MAG: WS/DGAT domain-containing protein, partial [Pseudomonadota bacterium]
MGLFIGTPSYDGKMSFCVISTREILPDIEFFMACLEASLAELLGMARREGVATAPKRSGDKTSAKSAKAASSKNTTPRKKAASRKKATPEKRSAPRKKVASRKKAVPRKKTSAASGSGTGS